jgi:hypothetical protein
MQRQFKYVDDLNDTQQCEREAIRMLRIVRNLFYDSEQLLLAFVMPSTDANMLSKIEG